jgi:hypothetical protein
MQFLKNFLDFEPRDTGVKLWDVITTFLLLEYPIEQKSICQKLLVSWTGKTQIEPKISYKNCCDPIGKKIGNNTNCFVSINGKDFDEQFVMRFFE